MIALSKSAQKVLDAYFRLLDAKLIDFLEAYYVTGSLALGAYTEGWSDIDFVAVVKNRVSDDEIMQLERIHRQLQRSFPTLIMDGKYILKSDLEKLNNGEQPYLLFNEGKYRGIRHMFKDHIDTYQLKTFGVAIRGAVIGKFNIELNWDQLIAGMHGNMDSYWVEWRSRFDKVFSLSNFGLLFKLETVEWGVLGVCRLYYTFRERGIVSKVGAGDYTLQLVPVRWHKIINESMRLRKGIKQSYYRSISERRRDTLAFIDYMMKECKYV